MVALTENGWPVNPAGHRNQRVPGTGVDLNVRDDPAGWVLLEFFGAWDRCVEDIDNIGHPLDDWGYANRPIRGGTQNSNHSGAVAGDVNAPRHPLGIPAWRNFTGDQIDAIHWLLDVAQGVIRWGGDYDNPARGGYAGSRPDPMHSELAPGTSMADCERVLPVLRSLNAMTLIHLPGGIVVPILKEGDGVKGGGDRGRLHWYVLRAQALVQPGISGVAAAVCPVDGVFGPATTAAIRAFQADRQLPVTGVVDAATWTLLLGNDAPDYA